MVKRISHVGIIVEDLRRAAQEWCERYGLQVVEELLVEVEGIRSVMLSPGYAWREGFCVELMEPLDKSDMHNVIARRLAENGEGVFHIAMEVDDSVAAEGKLRELGVNAFGAPSIAEGERPRTLVHPKWANGVLLELL
jgi:methylmalonyl-CoA/ethylmalonyl-CoA epimerase